MRPVQFLSEKISEGRGDTGWYEIPDHITEVEVTIDRGTFANPLPYVDQDEHGSPLTWWLSVSFDKGKTSSRVGGGVIKGGNWVSVEGLEDKTWFRTDISSGVRRLVRVEYDARVGLNKPIGLHFK